MNGHSDDHEEFYGPQTDEELGRRQEEDAAGAADADAQQQAATSAPRRCAVCDGTGWMAYPHPDDDGGMTATAYEPCPTCVAEDSCPACGGWLMEWGAVGICISCGFVFDEAAVPGADLIDMRMM